MKIGEPRILQLLTGSVEVAWAHPLAHGLVWLAAAGRGAGPVIDLVSGRRGTTTIGTWGVGQGGLWVRDWAISNATTTNLAFTSGAWSIAAFGRVSAVPGTAQSPTLFGRSAYVTEASNSGWFLCTRASNDGFAPGKYVFGSFRSNAFANWGIASTTSVTVGDHMMVGTSDGSSLRTLYLDGIAEGTNANNANPTSTAGDLLNTSVTAQYATYVSYAWTRTLSASEVVWLSTEPWALISRPRERHVFDVLGSAIPVPVDDPIPRQHPTALMAPILAQ